MSKKELIDVLINGFKLNRKEFEELTINELTYLLEELCDIAQED